MVCLSHFLLSLTCLFPHSLWMYLTSGAFRKRSSALEGSLFSWMPLYSQLEFGHSDQMQHYLYRPDAKVGEYLIQQGGDLARFPVMLPKDGQFAAEPIFLLPLRTVTAHHWRKTLASYCRIDLFSDLGHRYSPKLPLLNIANGSTAQLQQSQSHDCIIKWCNSRAVSPLKKLELCEHMQIYDHIPITQHHLKGDTHFRPRRSGVKQRTKMAKAGKQPPNMSSITRTLTINSAIYN